jgi:homoserine kinase
MLQGALVGLGKALSLDKIVEARRAPLIPSMKAAIEARAFRCTISGAGLTAVAVVESEEKGEMVGERMVEAFWREGSLKAVKTF